MLLIYFVLLKFLVSLPASLENITFSFILKNQLHASSVAVASFGFFARIPLYLGFAFGIIRDLWNPLGLRDRGFLLIFGLGSVATFLGLAFLDLSYAHFISGVLLLLISGEFIGAAVAGLSALIAQERLMSGRLSALLLVAGIIPTAAGQFLFGPVERHFSVPQTFLLLGSLPLLLSLFSLWKPPAVFRSAYSQPEATPVEFLKLTGKLARHKAIYPVIMIILLWEFAPGVGTPLQFYLTNNLHAKDSAFGDFIGLFRLFEIPGYFFHFFICRRVRLGTLLWWATIVGIPSLLPLALIHSADAALWLAPAMGLMCGFASAAYINLAVRSCPPGLQGTMMTLVAGMAALAEGVSDLVGAKLYSLSTDHGFLYCAIAATVVIFPILPLIRILPRSLITTTDGQPISDSTERPVLGIAEAGTPA